MVQPTLRRSARIRKKKNGDSMVQPTLRMLRSARIRKMKNNGNTDGEPRSKIQLLSRKSELGNCNEVSSNRGDYTEDGGSSVSQEECFIEQLPVEVLKKIFNCLAPPVILGRKYFNSACIYLRLVCKKWCDILSHHQRVYFDQIVPHPQLENCGFERIRLQLYEIDLRQLPLSTWEKIGCKIDSLVLKYCQIGDHCLKNITEHCCNLQSLEVVFEDSDNNADLFCSPDMLRELRITQKNLRTFKINNNVQNTVNVTKWIQILTDLFKIFPNVTHFTSGYSYNRTSRNIFQMKFSRDPAEDNMSRMATNLAYSLSNNRSHHLEAFDSSSTLRLDNHYPKIQKYLYSIFSIVDVLKMTFYFKIPTSSIEHKIKYYNVIPVDDLHNSSNLEFFKVNINSFYWSSLIIHPLSGKLLAGFAWTWDDNQYHLVGDSAISDDFLQNIFKNSINLKALSIAVTDRNTNLGITGRHIDAPGVCTSHCKCVSCDPNSSTSTGGYSINRLKELEELVIIGIKLSQMNDIIFYEFVFPKLLFLSVDIPDDPMTLLPIMGQNMPALVKIHFTSKIKNDETRKDFKKFKKSLVSFCRLTKKLREIILHEYTVCETTLGFGISTRRTIKIFKVCPSLRSIEGRGIGKLSSAYYDPSTRQLVIKDVYQKSTKWTI